jgi:hypothetical protein
MWHKLVCTIKYICIFIYQNFASQNNNIHTVQKFFLPIYCKASVVTTKTNLFTYKSVKKIPYHRIVFSLGKNRLHIVCYINCTKSLYLCTACTAWTSPFLTEYRVLVYSMNQSISGLLLRQTHSHHCSKHMTAVITLHLEISQNR